jgi:hypothetical protein
MPSSRTLRRTIAALVAMAAVLLAVHLVTGQPGSSTRPTAGRPAVHLMIRGQVTAMGPNTITVTAVDRQGQLTDVKHTIVLAKDTRVIWPSAAGSGPATSGQTLKVGYLVTVSAHSLAGGTWAARSVLVSYPPIQGTLLSVSGNKLMVQVQGQTRPTEVELTSRTAFYVPGGQFTSITVGTPVRVYVRPGPNSTWQAVSVVIGPSSGGS